MQLTDITIISSEFPPSIGPEPNRNSINLLTMLLHSKFFNDSINAYISNNNIQQTSIKPVIDNINNELSKALKQGFSEYSEISKKLSKQWRSYDRSEELTTIVSILGLPVDYEYDIFLLAKYKSFRNIDTLPWIFYIENKQLLQHYIDDYNERSIECSSIIFRHRVSKADFHKWVDENWEYIEESMMLDLPVSPIIKTDFKDIELASEIYDLYNSEKKPSEILTSLSEKYENDQATYDILSLEFIKNKIKRFKKLLDQKESQLSHKDAIKQLSQ